MYFLLLKNNEWFKVRVEERGNGIYPIIDAIPLRILNNNI